MRRALAPPLSTGCSRRWAGTSRAPLLIGRSCFTARHRTSPSLGGEAAWDDDLTDEEIDARGDQVGVPDYSFHTCGTLRFCVEAKRPHTGITGRSSVFQVKTYAWNRGLPFSVITDFARLRVYTTLARPDRDRPEAGLLAGYDLRHTDYVEQWDALWSLLSREGVAAGRSERRVAVAAPRGALGVGSRSCGTWRVGAPSSAATCCDGSRT